MRTISIAPAALLLTLLAAPAPVVGQGIPDNIPDLPGESPADRAKERAIEENRGLLARLFASGSVDASPVPVTAFGYQTNISVGVDLQTGDAIFFAVNGRTLPVERDPLDRDLDPVLMYVGAGFTLTGTRLLGDTEAGRRADLSTELGVWTGNASMVALDLVPTYEILQGNTWSVPLGIRFSVARVSDADISTFHPFVGLSLGVKWHFFSRDRLDVK